MIEILKAETTEKYFKTRYSKLNGKNRYRYSYREIKRHIDGKLAIYIVQPFMYQNIN